MARLFTFGCSYTAYEFFPTWADMLGLEFDHYENWGVTGIGNRGIAERVAECHVKNKFTPDDIIIVQWTSHVRHDYFNPESQKRPTAMGWKTSGNIFYPGNRDVFTDTWIKDFFFEPAYVMHGLNSMILVQELLKSIGCIWYMTSVSEWTKLGSDLAFTRGRGTNVPVDLRDHSPRFLPYVKVIWEDHKDHWLEPIALHATKTPELYWYFNNAQRPGERYLELHPSPEQHLLWLKERLIPRIAVKLSDKQDKWVRQLNKIKQDTGDIVGNIKMAYYDNKTKNNYELEFWPPEKIWPLVYKGF